MSSGITEYVPPSKPITMPESFNIWASLIEKTDLTDIQKHAIQTRVISVAMRLRARLRRLSAGYNCLRTTSTVGSLLVPSLLTLQSPNQPASNPEAGFSAYWAIWGIGLIVGISNAFVSLFRVDKNYFTVGNLLQKLESEAWLFLTQSGPYNPDYDEEDARPTTDVTGETGHRLKFRSFIETCEMLINKAVRTEYTTGFKTNTTHIGGASTNGTTSGTGGGNHVNGMILREAPSSVAEMYQNTRETTPPANVPKPIDGTGRNTSSNPSSTRGGHPVSSVSRANAKQPTEKEA